MYKRNENKHEKKYYQSNQNALKLEMFRRKLPGRVAQSVGHLTRKSGVLGSIHIFFLLPLFQEGQLSVTGESMWTKYWLIA